MPDLRESPPRREPGEGFLPGSALFWSTLTTLALIAHPVLGGILLATLIADFIVMLARSAAEQAGKHGQVVAYENPTTGEKVPIEKLFVGAVASLPWLPLLALDRMLRHGEERRAKRELLRGPLPPRPMRPPPRANRRAPRHQR